MPNSELEATVLRRQECLEFLGRVSIGRIGVSIEALPAILPVQFALRDDSVLVRTIPGTKLDAATIGAVVAFQAEAWEPADQLYWSVLLQGLATEVGDDRNAQREASAIRSWGGVDRAHRLVRIEATKIAGRRFHIAGEGPQVEFPDPPPL
jgi:nitroimidazol reductase NimA-like FMN-containing flavoprotein (pyridoxamine 5'-phosphate oxidase superfamily)